MLQALLPCMALLDFEDFIEMVGRPVSDLDWGSCSDCLVSDFTLPIASLVIARREYLG